MKFRGKECTGWVILGHKEPEELTDRLNSWMKTYEFLDCQYSIKDNLYTALVLLGEKYEKREM